MVQYNGNAYAKRFTIQKAWGGSPSTASIEFVVPVSVTPRSDIAISLGDQTFHGVVKDQKTITSEGVGINATTITYEDERVKTKWEHIQAAFNMKSDDGLFLHLRQDDWELRKWQVYVEDEDNPGEYIFKNFSDYKPETDGETLPITGEQIFNILADKIPDFDLTFSSEAQDVIENNSPENLNWTEGQRIYNALVEMAEKLRLKYRTTNQKGELYFEVVDKNQIVDFGADDNVPNKTFGTSDTYAPEQVIIIGDSDLHEVIDIELEPGWNTKYNKYAFKNALLKDDIEEEKKNPNYNRPPEFMPVRKVNGEPPTSDSEYGPWRDDDFLDIPDTDEDKLRVSDYVSKYVYRKYDLPEEIEIKAGPFAGIYQTKDLLPLNESGLISEKNKPKRKIFKVLVHSKIVDFNVNYKEPIRIVEKVIDEASIAYFGGTPEHPGKCSIIFDYKKFKVKDGSDFINPDGSGEINWEDIVNAEPKFTAVFPVNRYSREVGSGQIKSFHKIQGLFNEYIDTSGPIDTNIDDFADNVGNLILSKVNEVNTGNIQRVGTTVGLGPGIQSYNASVDGDQGLVQQLQLTDQRPGPSIPTSIEKDREQASIVELQEAQGPRNGIDAANFRKTLKGEAGATKINGPESGQSVSENELF